MKRKHLMFIGAWLALHCLYSLASTSRYLFGKTLFVELFPGMPRFLGYTVPAMQLAISYLIIVGTIRKNAIGLYASFAYVILVFPIRFSLNILSTPLVAVVETVFWFLVIYFLYKYQSYYLNSRPENRPASAGG